MSLKSLIKEYKNAKAQGIPLHAWYVILWRLLMFVPYRVSLVLTCALAACTWGKYAAEEIWKAGT